MNVLQVCAYGASQPGNFISSLEELEEKLKKKGISTIYVFVERAGQYEWCHEIQKRTKVYFLPEAKARISPVTYKRLRKIYKENDIGIVHSHFELYDIPATVMAPAETKVFWHLHDPIDGGQGIRKILWKMQYGVIGHKAELLSVSDVYRKKAIELGFPANKTHVLLNGISLNRIKPKKVGNEQYDFLTFGWDFYRKGDDIIIQACEKLDKEGYRFKLLLNGNAQTWKTLHEYLQSDIPDYIVCGNPVENVSELFHNSRVFIQGSRRETFSYAVCEAAYAGLPVISSDIAGLEWAHKLPTVSFFENEDSNALYSIMKSYLDGKSLKSEDVKLTQNIIESEFSISIWAERVMEYYESKKVFQAV